MPSIQQLEIGLRIDLMLFDIHNILDDLITLRLEFDDINNIFDDIIIQSSITTFIGSDESIDSYSDVSYTLWEDSSDEPSTSSFDLYTNGSSFLYTYRDEDLWPRTWSFVQVSFI